MIFFTSGSTGPAKGVTHTRETLRWMIASAAMAFELRDEDIFFPGSSMSHIGSFLWALATLSALIHDHDLRPGDFSSLRICRAGADKLSTELLTEFAAAAGFPIVEGYGMTEVGLATLDPPLGRSARARSAPRSAASGSNFGARTVSRSRPKPSAASGSTLGAA